MKLKLQALSLLMVCLLSIHIHSATAQSSEKQPVVSKQILQTSATWDGGNIAYPNKKPAEITALQIEFPPGSETEWHRHPVPSLAYIMSGELEVTIKDGDSKTFQEGDAFAEVINTWHYGKNIGDEPVRLVVFYVGEKGMKLTELLSEVEKE